MERITRTKKISLFVLPSGISILALAGLAYMASSGGRQPAPEGKPGGAPVAIPDARFREMIAESQTRLQAAVQAGEQKMASAVPLLKQYAVSDKDPEIRAACVRSMGQIGDPDGALALVTAGEDSEQTVKLAAIEAMGLVFDPACEKELIRQLRKEDPEIRRLGKEANPATGALPPPRKEDLELRRAAAKALAGFRSEETSAALSRALDDKDEPTRIAAVTELGQRKDPRAREGLARALGDASVAVRELASRALAREASGADWPALARALLDAEPAVREPALSAARKVGAAIVPEIEKALASGPATSRNPSAATLPAREAAARLLMTFGGADTVPALLRCLDRLKYDKAPPQPAEALRSAIVEHVSAMGAAVLEPLTRSGIQARLDVFAKEAAAQICVKLGPAAAKPINAHILARTVFPSPTELKVWVRTLGEVGDAASASALNRALAQDVPGIDDLVGEARKRIEARTGTALPPAKPDFGYAGGRKGYQIDRTPPLVPPPIRLEHGKLPPDAQIMLRLADALRFPANPSVTRRLDIVLARRNGAWEKEVLGFADAAPRYNRAFHDGAVMGGDDRALHVEMIINDDAWTPGGFGDYRIELEPGPDGLAGRYQGVYNHRKVSGAVTGQVFHLPDLTQTDVPPLESGEHPRLVFRKGELAAMRQRAQTDLGRAIVRAIRDRVEAHVPKVPDEEGVDAAIGAGFMFALFGDEAMGRRAVPALIATARRTGYWHMLARGVVLRHAAVAYDFAYDCLTEEENKEVAQYLRDMQGICIPSVGLTGNFNNGPGSNWTACGAGGTGMAALVMLREKGPLGLQTPMEVKPVFEFAGDTELGETDGVPVNAYESGDVLKRWLIAGPLEGQGGGDPLAALGGAEKARPTTQSAVVHGGSPVKFVPLAEAAVRKVDGFGIHTHKLVLPAAVPGSRSILYSFLKVEKEVGAVVGAAFPFGFERADLWINGKPVPGDSGVIFKPGTYRLLLDVRGPVVCPVFRDQNVYLNAGRYQRYLRQREAYEAAVKRHQATGERQDIPVKLSIARWSMVSWWRESIGDHGWGAESEYAHAHGDILPFTISYETATGQRVIPGTGIPWLYPLAMACNTASGDLGHGEHKGAHGFSSVKGAPLGLITHVTDPAVLPAVLTEFLPGKLQGTLAKMSCKELVYLFATYPLDVKPRPLEEVMPKAIEDRKKGGYVLRSSYDKGSDDIVAGLFLRSHSAASGYFYCESGTFLLAGLGTYWAVGLPGDKRNWQYAQENVVLMPPNNGEGLGKRIYADLKPDGSGVVGADMTDVYRTIEGAKATRHVAVDYSGASGAPALIAIVDSVQGGGEKTWIMHTGGASTAVNGNAFTIAGKVAGTSLAGQLIPSDGVRLATGPIVWRMRNPEFKKQERDPKRVVVADVDVEKAPEFIDKAWGSATTLKAISKNEKADYVFVMTIQKGPPPKFEVEGRGIQAKVKVGKRTVRFDADKGRLVLE